MYTASTNALAAFDSFRAPLSASDRAKRIASGGLNARQIELLDRYGYPYVMEEFRFHMTVTDRLSDADRDPWDPSPQSAVGNARTVSR